MVQHDECCNQAWKKGVHFIDLMEGFKEHQNEGHGPWRFVFLFSLFPPRLFGCLSVSSTFH